MPSINLPTKPPTEPTHELRLPHPPPPVGSVAGSQIGLEHWDARTVEVSGIDQCTAIFIRNDLTGARYAAHFGGWANNRRPRANDMRGQVHRVIFDAGPPRIGGHRTGFAHISVTICKRSTSPQNSLAEAETALRAVLPGDVPIVRAKAPGRRFFFEASGAVFGIPA